MTESSALGIFVLRPTGRGEPILLLPGDSLVVGRTEEAELPLFHDSISRSHARLTHQGTAVQVRDLGSANGTFVNGERCQETLAGPGDRLGFGALEFRLARATDAEMVPTAWKGGGRKPGDRSGAVATPKEEGRSGAIVVKGPPMPPEERAVPPASREPGPWRLRPVEEGEPIELAPGTTLIVGRGKEADVLLDHPKVSRQHARVVGSETELVIEDLGSSNGTFVGEQRIEKLAVGPGARVRFGGVELVVEREGMIVEAAPEGVLAEEAKHGEPAPRPPTPKPRAEPASPAVRPKAPSGEILDLVVVGAGPAGLSAVAHAHANGMRYVLLERSDHLADTIFCYQKGKHVMDQPREIPLQSDVPFEAGSRESILGAWQQCTNDRSLAVRLEQEVIGLERENGTLTLWSRTDAFRAAKVVLAIGTQGNPREMGVPGQDQPHVSDRLVDPDLYEGRSLVVVGAGDSALEIALALCERNRVFLVVRKPEIARAKDSLARGVLKRQVSGELQILYSTVVEEVVPGGIRLKSPQGAVEVEADEIFVKIGTLPPRGFLAALGVGFAAEGREARPDLSGVYETTVPGLHVIGATTGRDLIKFAMNQGFEVVEHLLGREVVPADEAVLNERLPFWKGSARDRILQVMDAVPLVGAAAGEPGEGIEKRRASAAEQLRELLLGVQPRRYGRNETIVRQNDYTNSVLAVVRGRVEIRRTDEQDREQRLAVLQAGDYFGEMALISGRRRNATAIALEPAEILEIPRKAILRLIYSNRGVRRKIDEAFLVRAFQNYLPSEVPLKEVWDLAQQSETMEVDRGEVIYSQGDLGDAVYLLRSGQVKVSKTSGERDLVVCYLTAGNVFGEGAMVSGEARPVTVTAIFPSTLIKLGRDPFLRFLGRYPGLKPAVVERLEAERYEMLQEEATPGAGRLLDELIREEVVMGTDALIIDEYKCVRCNNCIRACEDVHSDGQARLSLTGIVFANILAPNSCWQCENPLCMLDCPPDALYRDARGEVRIRDNCIGCGNCEENCPYDNIFMVHPRQKFSLTSWVRSIFSAGGGDVPDRTVAVKCDLCSDIAGGPACVRSCPTGAAIRVQPEEYQAVIGDLLVATRH
jgi:CRP-like cAMP-binding protein/thioredoxin reductase/pSer/pThr/pTyr-binding forkhead associated (FHA) protein